MQGITATVSKLIAEILQIKKVIIFKKHTPIESITLLYNCQVN